MDPEESYIVEDVERPDWLLSHVDGDVCDGEYLVKCHFGADMKQVWSDPEALAACLKVPAMAGKDEKGVAKVKWIMSFMFEKLREDASLFACFEAVFKSSHLGKGVVASLALDNHTDTSACNKIAWVHSSLIANYPSFFSDNEVASFVESLKKCSQIGKLDAIANLLKSSQHRRNVWPLVKGTVEKATPLKADEMYKCITALWMLSYDAELMASGKGFAVLKLKHFFASSFKVEKVVRLGLVVLENFLASDVLKEDIATSGIEDEVKALEYEKWRDSELYDHIRSVSQAVSQAVTTVSDFPRYRKELETGSLNWSYLHSSKFWMDNHDKVTEADVEALAHLLARNTAEDAASTTTRAVVCNDLGEIAVLAKEGKAWIQGKSGAKDRVMQLVQDNRDSQREVRREALLCCQKIMLNKWDVAQK